MHRQVCSLRRRSGFRALQARLGLAANHPVPQWLRDGKFGIYTHWGVYSVPAMGPNATWFANIAYWDPNSPERKQWEKTYRPADEVRLQGFHPHVHGREVRSGRLGRAFPAGRGPVRRPGGGASRRVRYVGHKILALERRADGPQAGRGRRVGRGGPQAEHEIRRRLPPRRELALFPHVRQAIRLRRPALLGPVRFHPREERPAEQGLSASSGRARSSRSSTSTSRTSSGSTTAWN